MTVFCVKVRKVNQKRWGFLTPRGGVNYLRIHASQFYDESKADACAHDIVESNPGEWQARVEVFARD